MLKVTNIDFYFTEEFLADMPYVRVAMYGALVEKLKIVGGKYALLFDFTDASRAKT